MIVKQSYLNLPGQIGQLIDREKFRDSRAAKARSEFVNLVRKIPPPSVPP